MVVSPRASVRLRRTTRRWSPRRLGGLALGGASPSPSAGATSGSSSTTRSAATLTTSSSGSLWTSATPSGSSMSRTWTPASISVEAADVDVELRGQVGGEALDAQGGDQLLQRADLGVDHGGRLADDDHGHVGGELLAQVDGEEVGVDGPVAARVDLHLAHQHLLGAAAVDAEVDELGAAGAHPDAVQHASPARRWRAARRCVRRGRRAPGPRGGAACCGCPAPRGWSRAGRWWLP